MVSYIFIGIGGLIKLKYENDTFYDELNHYRPSKSFEVSDLVTSIIIVYLILGTHSFLIPL